MTNAAYKSFKIKNVEDDKRIKAAKPIKAFDVWWPYIQLGVGDGTSRDENTTVTEYM